MIFFYLKIQLNIDIWIDINKKVNSKKSYENVNEVQMTLKNYIFFLIMASSKILEPPRRETKN